MTAYSEYKVVNLSEGALGTLFLGASGLPIKKLEALLNENAAQGWEVVFQLIEKRRMLLFWQRESIILTLGRRARTAD